MIQRKENLSLNRIEELERVQTLIRFIFECRNRKRIQVEQVGVRSNRFGQNLAIHAYWNNGVVNNPIVAHDSKLEVVAHLSVFNWDCDRNSLNFSATDLKVKLDFSTKIDSNLFLCVKQLLMMQNRVGICVFNRQMETLLAVCTQ